MKQNIKMIAGMSIVTMVLVFLSIKLFNQFKELDFDDSTISIPIALPEEEPMLEVGQTTRDQAIKHVEWTYRNGKSYEQDSLVKDGPKDYVVTYYQPYNSDPNLKTWQETKGGMLVFYINKNKPELIWESTNKIESTRPLVSVRDITGDGVNEIAALWQNGKSEVLYIYKFNSEKKSFDLITPLEQSGLEYGSTAFSPVFGGEYGTVQIVDLDKDGLLEVSILRSYPKEFYEAYKWNGKEYYLWKTSPTPFAPYSPF